MWMLYGLNMFQRYWWVLLVMIPVGMVAGLALSRVHLYFVPRVYESEIILQIKYNPPSGETIESVVTPQYMTRAVFEPIKSRTILSKVSEKLELEKSWGVDKDTVIARLKDAVQVMKIRGTDLLSIKVRTTDPIEACDIARELVTVYREWRTEMEKESLDARLEALKKAVQKQEDEVEQARKDLQILMEIKGIETLANDVVAVEAKRNFEQKSDVYDAMKLKLVREEIDSSLIETDIVIHAEPVIPTMPVGLSDRLLKLNWMAGGVLFSPLLALPVMALLNRRRRPEMA
jgi:capsular polysaccharide biosynthesis protein